MSFQWDLLQISFFFIMSREISLRKKGNARRRYLSSKPQMLLHFIYIEEESPTRLLPNQKLNNGKTSGIGYNPELNLRIEASS